MPLAPGARLGPYEVIGAIGAGGMGEVYRARDTKLGRDVALKVLPDHLVGDPERAVRFEREAQALAALNHPNVAQIYGTEGHALVMEFVPGDDLAARIGRGPIAADDAIAIARQISLALEAAHALSIVHRDLKPANIKVGPDGAVKVLDFGLARIGAPDSGVDGQTNASNSPTMTSPATAIGVILGTAAYMSPEQARGRPVDKRADIWAFGCVLFEMLAGKPVFRGDTVTDVIAGVVTKEPDWTALPAGTPRSVRGVLKRCLQKDPKQRLHDIADARLELEAGEAQDDAAASPTTATPAPARSSWLALVATALIAAIAGAGSGVAWRVSRERPPSEWTGQLLGGPAISMHPRVSPDGHLVSFLAMVNGQTQVAVMKPGAASWTVLTSDRTRGLVYTSSWAPDGSAIYYDRITDIANGIYSVGALGGDERLVIENASTPHALPDGSILFARINPARVWQLHRFWPGSGKTAALPIATFNRSGNHPHAAAIDENRIVVYGHPVDRTSGIDSLHVFDLSSGQLRAIAANLENAIASFSVDRTNRTILAVAIDGSMYRVLRISPDDETPPETLLSVLDVPVVDVGRNGELYVSLMERQTEVVLANWRDGAVDRVLTGPTMLRGGALALADGRILIPSRSGTVGHILVAPPGREPYRFVQTDEETRAPMTPLGEARVALLIGNSSPRDIAIVAADTGRIVKRIKPPADVTSLAASPDGRTIYYAAAQTIVSMPADGGAPTSICAGDSMAVDPASGDLIVKLEETERVRLVRCKSSGPPRDIAIHGDLRLVATPLLPDAIRDGRLLLAVGSADSWYWFIGALDLASGRLERVKINHFTDFHFASWTADGKVLGGGSGVRSALWKFEKK
jgi:serine/threonine protein kinase